MNGDLFQYADQPEMNAVFAPAVRTFAGKILVIEILA
jgi:hypothetical protein